MAFPNCHVVCTQRAGTLTQGCWLAEAELEGASGLGPFTAGGLWHGAGLSFPGLLVSALCVPGKVLL